MNKLIYILLVFATSSIFGAVLSYFGLYSHETLKYLNVNTSNLTKTHPKASAGFLHDPTNVDQASIMPSEAPQKMEARQKMEAWHKLTTEIYGAYERRTYEVGAIPHYLVAEVYPSKANEDLLLENYKLAR